MRLAWHLWQGIAPAPPELISYVLCKEVYGCTPSQLDEQSTADVLSHLTVHNELIRMREAKNK